jgi:hypothetical protein
MQGQLILLLGFICVVFLFCLQFLVIYKFLMFFLKFIYLKCASVGDLTRLPFFLLFFGMLDRLFLNIF